MSDNQEHHDNGHGHHEHLDSGKTDIFFEESTVAIGFVYSIITIGVILTIYFFG